MIDINKYSPVGEKDCEGICDREVLIINDNSVIICHGCNRIVIDNR